MSDILLVTNFDIPDRHNDLQKVFNGRKVIEWASVQSSNSFDPTSIKYAIVWKPLHGLLKSLPNLEVIFSWGAGVDHLLSDQNLPDVPIVRFVDPDLTQRMVEYVVLQVLMHTRRQRQYDKLQTQQKWHELVDPTASDLRVGIMGFGELGKASARGLLPLGYKINSWSRSPKMMDGVTSYSGDAELDDFLAHSDILVSLLPHTKATHGIINKDLIAKLARNGPFGAPVIINAGRGGSQVEADISDALTSGALHGVSLDVFENEPLDPNSPLWKFENAILTPHIAAISSVAAVTSYVKTQIDRYEAGQPLEHLIDPSQGY